MRSKVKWFDEQKGYGFIENQKSGEDIFVHYKSIDIKGYKRLEKGEEVEFELDDAGRGLKAINVKPIHETKTIS